MTEPTTSPTRSMWLHRATFATFVLVLVGPWIAGALGASSDTVERRAPAVRPPLDGDALLDSQTFARLNNYVRDRTPLRGQATGWVNGAWLSLGVSADRTVMEGPDEYYFLTEDFTEPCNRRYELDDMVEAISTFGDAAIAGDKEFLFLVASDKGAVLDYRLSGRAEVAAGCGRVARTEFRSALDGTGYSFDLAPSLIAADRAAPDPGRWYYEHDSHWTFEGGGIVAGDIVKHFEPDLFDAKLIRKIQRALPINGDVYRRMGIQRSLDEPDPVRVSERPDVFEDRSEQQINGTRTVRTYLNGGDGQVIEGTTIVVHDSMMNFVERQLAPYFEEIVFIHWDDLDKAGFNDRVAAADRVLMVRVERGVHATIASTLLDDGFAAPFVEALRSRSDPDLGADLQAGTSAIRAFTRDTGGFVTEYADLLRDPGLDGWNGPYLEGEPFVDAHPTYGQWSTVHEPTPEAGSIIDCADYNSGDCGVWLTLPNVPSVAVESLDAEFDGGDGSAAGRVRHDADGTLYFYSLA